MTRRRRSLLLAVVILLLGRAFACAAQQVPYLQGRITDNAEILSADAQRRISAKLKAHEDSTTNQVAVLTTASLEDESIEDFAVRVFEQWELGQQGKDNGILILIAPNERRMRIEVGYGLEAELTDLEAGRIIRNIMAPRFKAGDFDGGVEQGVDAVVGQLSGDDSLPPENAGRAEKPAFIETPRMSTVERVLFGAFIFGIIGLFTVIGVLTPGMGWFLYFFLIPFWAMFPIIVVGTTGAATLLGIYLVVFPISKVLISRSGWFKKAQKQLRSKGKARIGGFTLMSGGGSSSSSRSGGWHSSSSGSFSGGGGGSGGGGASGSW